MKFSLPNGCSCSRISVSPKTWDRLNASIKKDWFIYYRFYDPLFQEKYKYGFLKIIKGLKEYPTLKERQDACRELIQDEWQALKERGYNPITRVYTAPAPEPDDTDYIIHPNTPMIKALEKALERLDVVPEFRKDIESNLKFIKQAAEQLRMADRPVKDTKRRHIIAIFDQCGKNKDVWTASTYNRYRRNLSCVFRELVKIEAIEHNPIDTYLEQKKGTKLLKEVLTQGEIQLINTRLRESNFPFWRFIHIFCNSGARTTEIMKVQLKDVDLSRQMVKYHIKKGKVKRIVERPIKTEVLHLWEQLVIEAKKVGPKAYLFSAGLLPGTELIRTDQIRHRWRLWVQIKLGIKKTWYSLKHLNTDTMDSLYGSDIAAHLNQHDKKMVDDHYAVGKTARKNEVLKQAPNPLMMNEVIP